MSEHYVASGYSDPYYANEGIEILWGQRIIFVPKSETTLIQSTPTEIRELDINTFRIALKDLEDNEEGMSNPDTHRHNTTVLLGGITYARVVEIINDYTITFEDGKYAINLTGANSNVADKVNVNQVSVRAANSAGLIQTGGTDPASIASAVWSHSTAVTAVADLAFIKGIEGGRWKIIANQMIFYAADNATEIARFDLKDATGAATMSNPMERVRV